MSRISRREFLKLTALAGLSPLVSYLPASASAGSDQPNIIVILFDALSARNLALYGYQRPTTPNLERFAGRATVYHNHHAAGNFTTPSTASFFTSLYPWTHRAFNLSGLVKPELRPHNLFAALGPSYHRLAFTQNVYADMLLHQFNAEIDQHEALDRFSLVSNAVYSKATPNDAIYGMKSLDQFMFKREEAHGSLFLSIINDMILQVQERRQAQAWAQTYPEGLPRLANTDIYFAFEKLTDGLMGLLSSLPQPTFAYTHLMPPHAPYLPTQAFAGRFKDDGWQPDEIKRHKLGEGVPQARLNQNRQEYDEFVLNMDAEFGRLIQHLEKQGVLDNSYVIFTSDHGEMFERGTSGHGSPLMFEALLNIPLLISAPGQKERRDVHSLTSTVDLLPTMLHLAGQLIPDWAVGRLLPGLGRPGADDEQDPNRRIYSVEAKANPAYQPLRKASTAVLQERYKLTHYVGYRYGKDVYEFYDLKDDPGEMNNLFDEHPVAKELQADLDAQQARADEPYV
jgi:arylsulfatase A-like enzyme